MRALLKKQGVWTFLSKNTLHVERHVIEQMEEKYPSIILHCC